MLAPAFDKTMASVERDPDLGIDRERSTLIVSLATLSAGVLWSRLLCPWDRPEGFVLSGVLGLTTTTIGALMISRRAVWQAARLSLHVPAWVRGLAMFYPPPVRRFAARGLGGVMLTLNAAVRGLPLLIPVALAGALLWRHPSFWFWGATAAALLGLKTIVRPEGLPDR